MMCTGGGGYLKRVRWAGSANDGKNYQVWRAAASAEWKKNEKTYGRPTERTMRKDESHYNLLPQIISIISATYPSEKKKMNGLGTSENTQDSGFPRHITLHQDANCKRIAVRTHPSTSFRPAHSLSHLIFLNLQTIRYYHSHWRVGKLPPMEAE